MGDPKPLASLSSGLLARKGAARPAMRRQINFAPDPVEKVMHEDLGWNDMGYDVDPPQPAEPESIDPSGESTAKEPKSNPLAGAIPEVIKQQEELNRSLQDQTKAEEPVEETGGDAPARDIDAILSTKPVTAKSDSKPVKADIGDTALESHKTGKTEPKARTKRAAFTLRLDAERHLRLRLACAVQNQSAQQLVTQALDQMLDALPEIDALAGQIPGPKKTV
ncbi:hypothetical protein [Alterisphingorhabdus coralli]|uniref:Uncharacterized protein n=1 Tax=Alterisphingorhabdus coralli TaxID=3071408 RepID=A0AA97I111_9SPHN|nr:hypothetical protein [Parasphingorhabdus sp. SCSIO 66989]WOE74300.1 hypothetical protein RB602_10605 [Parasphingorhabdus sp. SCSIO 66989]